MISIPSVPATIPSKVATPADVGLGNVPNTAPADLPLSTAATAALATKADTGHGHGTATTSTPGFMSAPDKSKLDGVSVGATANSADAALRDRSTHTGLQGIDTVSGLQAALDTKRATGQIAPSEISPGGASSGQVLKWNGSAWAPGADLVGAGGGGGAVDSVFGRIGAVVAATGDYTFAQLGSKPTTLAGFGITDGAPLSHVGVGASAHAAVTTTANGFMVAADKVKLDGVAVGATANSADASLLSRTNHTGSQAISTITNLQSTLDGKRAVGAVALTEIAQGGATTGQVMKWNGTAWAAQADATGGVASSVAGAAGAPVTVTATQASSGNTQTNVSIQGSNSSVNGRPAGDINLTGGNNSAGGSQGSFNYVGTNANFNIFADGGLNYLNTNSDAISFGRFGGTFVNQKNFTFSTAGGLLLSIDESTPGTSTIGFFGSAGRTQPTVSGSRGGNAALGSLLTALAALGLINNTTTA